MMTLRFESLGGRSSAARFFGYRVSAMFGAFRRTRAIEAGRVRRLVFICSGNICRSPYAHWKVRDAGFPVASCGTAAIDGAPANESAIRVARDRGIDISAHVSTRIESHSFEAGDLAIALEPVHLAVAAPLALRAGAQATLLGMWCQPRLPVIPDPYAKSDACFQHIFGLVDAALERLLGTIAASGQTSDGMRACASRTSIVKNC
jgi:protein-tyrosine phosphatase